MVNELFMPPFIFSDISCGFLMSSRPPPKTHTTNHPLPACVTPNAVVSKPSTFSSSEANCPGRTPLTRSALDTSHRERGTGMAVSFANAAMPWCRPVEHRFPSKLLENSPFFLHIYTYSPSKLPKTASHFSHLRFSGLPPHVPWSAPQGLWGLAPPRWLAAPARAARWHGRLGGRSPGLRPMGG